jgi:hypothetical protein
MMIKFSLPVEASNAAIRTGKLQKIFQQLAKDLKPEAAYFLPLGGERSGFLSSICENPRKSRKSPSFFSG